MGLWTEWLYRQEAGRQAGNGDQKQGVGEEDVHQSSELLQKRFRVCDAHEILKDCWVHPFNFTRRLNWKDPFEQNVTHFRIYVYLLL